MNQLILEKYASNFRAQLGYSNTESIHLKSLLHKLGVLAVFRPLDMALSGIAIKSGDSNHFMLINTARTLGHQHFTICHELYHLFIQEGFDYQVCQVGLFDKKDKEEYNADIFASKFLIPEEGILALVPDTELKKAKVTLATILKIEQYFSCSRRALLNRLFELKLIDKIQKEEYKDNVRASAMNHGYSLKLYEKNEVSEVIGDYGNVARKLFEQDKISETHYYGLLEDIGLDFSTLRNDGDEKE
ncbi:ImmA/IrrE family metallo-endopeptidase [Mongoliitalea daihaiensis]|jgi:Zn-dependent peptidase ImmA (M78 family)|uniref:ImmA/IrrE family metallo-endopeptidase n=1 Tax=Mongoliitalea daihaiensis TaxID=2782006 RepID=UPI001F416280|nr:ImmA/IrrE family metallo-endopeptidase [Mongoliitalea daihaiensis]UJP65164.1 ImmA/IrrE family metallo-endopeptidase [Mongoliitalea daihaiensis]